MRRYSADAAAMLMLLSPFTLMPADRHYAMPFELSAFFLSLLTLFTRCCYADDYAFGYFRRLRCHYAAMLSLITLRATH